MPQKTTTLPKPTTPATPGRTDKSESTMQVFREFENAMLDLERRLDRVVRESFEDGDLPFPLLHGLSLNRDAGGRLRLQPFGHLAESVDKLFEGWREPALTWTVGEGGRALVFHAEVPGLRKEDLQVEVTKDSLRINGQSGNAKYRAECKPGYALEPDSGEARYNDGVLTVSCRLAKPDGQESRRLTVR